jgi:predicted RNase H-like HicB family nuclease
MDGRSKSRDAGTVKTYRLPVYVETLEEGGYLAVCESIQGCHAEGETIEKALENIEDVAAIVVELCLEEGLPLPQELGRRMPESIQAERVDCG